MRALFACAAVGLLSGCGLLLNGGPSVVDLQVVPEGAEITVKAADQDDVRHEKGPRVKLTLDRGSAYAILVTADGYKPRLARVQNRVALGYWLDLAPCALAFLATSNSPASQVSGLAAVLSLAGMIVDLLAHTAYEHDVHALDVILEKQGGAK
ncbi:MAG: hypothetical protein JWM80_3059 [Cyanobacteria bacterium RYN_339]|nr:hypothetical protein [Cyanobacteria bacterium RYN_339]